MRNMLFTSSGPGVEGALLRLLAARRMLKVALEYALHRSSLSASGEPLLDRMQAVVRRGLPFPIPEVSRKDVDAIIKAFMQLKRFTQGP